MGMVACFTSIPPHVHGGVRCVWLCAVCVAHVVQLGAVCVLCGGRWRLRIPARSSPCGRHRFFVQTRPPPSPESREYPCELTGGLSCVSGSIIVGRGGLWTCQNQRQDRQGETIGTAWSQGSALRGSSDGKEPRGDWHSFEPLVAAYVDAALSPTSETVVAMRLLKLSA